MFFYSLFIFFWFVFFIFSIYCIKECFVDCLEINFFIDGGFFYCLLCVYLVLVNNLLLVEKGGNEVKG